MAQSNEPGHNETTLADIKQLGLWAAIASLSYVFWVVGGMELVERLAYYGVRIVASLYATHPASEGGLGVTMARFGTLLLCWNLTQSLIPVFTGGLSDRYGYKQTIFASTILKSLGYLIMAWFHSFGGFFAGAICLATGTAIFKPGIQGTLIRASNRRNSSMAWGIFYQTVNIGGWIGPLIALRMRTLSWKYVFYINAAFICMNFLLLLTYREPGKEQRLARQQRIREGKEQQPSLWLEALHELKKPHLILYLAIFSVWWVMFPMILDVLPKFVDDWVDTRPMVLALFGEHGTQNPIWKFILGMDASGMTIQPEGIVNINAGMIMITCFLVAGFSARMRATNSMLFGTLLIALGLCFLGLTNLVWYTFLAIVIFSFGEMLASPKFSEFLGNIAPMDKKAMYAGFSQAPIMVGFTIEGKLGPQLYHIFSTKDEFAREMLLKNGFTPSQVTEHALPVGEAFNKLVQVTGQTSDHLTQLLYLQHHVGTTWLIFAGIGLVSAVMIYFYGLWLKTLVAREAGSSQAAPKTVPADTTVA
jgi:MFS family permease